MKSRPRFTSLGKKENFPGIGHEAAVLDPDYTAAKLTCKLTNYAFDNTHSK